jgi:chemotaxis regulatin CheY-phosphate phosphatase CheZ
LEKNLDIADIQSKVNEVKALFVLAQRVIPFVEDLFVFISETSPLLEELNTAIKDNLKKMPNATKQLTKVTQATETASTEIMDTVDRVNDDLYKVIKELEDFKQIQDQVLVNPLKLLETIALSITEGKDLSLMLDDINLFIERTKNVTNNEHTTIISNIVGKVNEISNDANSIINSLQMQDITTQQLAAVNNLLENVTSRLNGIMDHLNSSNGPSTNTTKDDSIKVSKLHRDIAFDPDAIDSMTLEGRQDDIDAMFANPDAINMALTPDEPTAEDEEDTDALLNSFASQAAAPAAEEEAEVDEFSQDDIDALFG